MIIPVKFYLYGGAVLALFLGYAGFVSYERNIGAFRQKAAVADSVAKAAVTASRAATARAATAEAEAAALRQHAYVEIQKDRAVAHRTDSALTATANERQRAEQLLADSLASFAQMRAEVVQLVAKSRADSVAMATERAQYFASRGALLAALAADTVALNAGVMATNAATARATAAERQRDLYKSAQPSGFGTVVRGLAWAAAGALLYAVVKR